MLWPESYVEGRAAFLTECAAHSIPVETFPHPLLGPTNECLSTDVATVGDPAAKSVLMVCTGTHGVEGFTGSACLLHWLRHGEDDGDGPGSLPHGVKVVLVHAINPHGYAWVRRVNENNVDLNRNFVDHTAPRDSNQLYNQAHPFVRPITENSAGWAAADAALQQVAVKNNASDAMRTVLGGQYDHPDGIFFGGKSPAWSNELIRRIVRQHCEDAARVLFLDLHTGLGPFGHAELMCNGRGPHWAAQLRQIFGKKRFNCNIRFL
eukprot:COSAG02_NODE_1787_length_10931_cov_2.224889_4_plen_264_part_00